MIEWYWLLAMMIFMHVIEDFHIQGILAQMKQKVWWYHSIQDSVRDSEDRHGNKADLDSESVTAFVEMRMRKYGKDYIVALLFHGFEWAFFVCIPLMYFVGLSLPGFVIMCAMAPMHSLIDHLKCNELAMNLIEDQAWHMLQIGLMLGAWVAV